MESNANSTSFVPSLDGVRTFAVGLVIAFHLSVPYLAPGFAGVDIFFVLSGYLITTGLLRDVDTHGRPRFALFWQRRFRRLLPAASVVLLVVLIYDATVLPLFRRTAAAEDVMWTALYLGNWHFMGADSYFNSDGVPSPLLHMWSLAVEEQFYLVWPLLLGGVAWVAGRRFAGRLGFRRLLGAVVVACVIVSLCLLVILYRPEATDRAYLGTDSKAFEPLLGALLAIILTGPRARGWFSRHQRILSVLGAVLVIGMLPLIGGPSRFYFLGGALLLSIGTALLIGVLVTSPGALLGGLLAWGPLAYLGRISYGLYLWHWPWAVWLGVAHNDDFRPVRAVGVLVGMLACSILSYHLIEQPIRSGGLSAWFTPRRVAAAVLAVMVFFVSWAAVLHNSIALAQGRRVLVVGDSVPLGLMEPLDRAARQQDVAIDHVARGGCPPLAIEMQDPETPDHEGPGDCRGLAAAQQERIDLFQPETVFWWSRYETQQRWVDGRLVGPDADEFWQVYERELASTVGRLTAGGAQLVIGLTERPGSVLVDRCTPEHCYKIHAQMLGHDEYRRRRNEIVTRLAEQDDRVRTLDMDPLLCLDPEPTVPGTPAACNDVDVDGPYRWDGTHVDIRVYGDRVAQRVLSGLLRAADR